MRAVLAAAFVLGLLPGRVLAESGGEPAHRQKGHEKGHAQGHGTSHHKQGGSQHKSGSRHGAHHGPSHHVPSHGHAHHPPSHGSAKPPHYGHPPRAAEYYYAGGWHGRIHGPEYVYPQGWHYRRWPIGGHLPAVFLTPPYFYADFAVVGLAAPAPGYAWVRFGPDLLLVNLQTGIVDDVVYGVFY
jgi:Ni/Co efflux regulator RcnB